MSCVRDAIDHIMEVMDDAFDPAFGEAWNRRQVSDALLLGNCRYLLFDQELQPLDGDRAAAGFTLSRQAADEEELLLIAVRQQWRRHGIASALVIKLLEEAVRRGVKRMFLEMRDGNPAEALYRRHGFQPVGRRPNYYNRGAISGVDAITFVRNL